MLQTSLSRLGSARRAGGGPPVSSTRTWVRNQLKTDLFFPTRRPGHFQDESPGGAWLLRRTWQDICLLPQGLDLSMVPVSWQEAVFQLALSAVEEEADQARISCANLGELGAPFTGALSPRTQSHCFHSARKGMHSAPDVTFKMHKRDTGCHQTEPCWHSSLMEWSSQAIQYRLRLV